MADPKVVLITGANTGIGYQIVRALYRSEAPYRVIVGARSTSKAEDAINAIRTEFPSSKNQLSPLVVDIEYDDQIQRAYDEVQTKFGKLDTLVNNAGVQFDHAFARGEITEREAWNRNWNINTSGTQVMTSTFIPLLLLSSDPRILFITSGVSTFLGSETDTALLANKSPEKGWPKTALGVAAYRASKTGLNMMMREWHRILKSDGVKVWAISPGMLATGLGGDPELLKRMGAGDPSVAGAFVRDVLEGKRDGDVGKVINRAGIQPW